jgi:cold shock protein
MLSVGLAGLSSESPAMSEEMTEQVVGAEGVVKWFDSRKGFGFIVGPQGQDIFTHFSVIEGDGFRVLRDGSKVHYDAVKGPKGWRATRVEQPAPTVEVVVEKRTADQPKQT